MKNPGNYPMRFNIAASRRLDLLGRSRSHRHSHSRGITSVIAMMYLMLISTMAVGFYAMTTISVQLSKNDDAGARAYMAAQSGMDFIRLQMANVHIPANTAPGSAIDAYYPNLQDLLNGTPNLGTQTIRRDGSVIYIPSNLPGNGNGYIKLDSEGDARFRATIQDSGGDITVKVDGFYGSSNAKRTITMNFSRQLASFQISLVTPERNMTRNASQRRIQTPMREGSRMVRLRIQT